MSVTNIQFKKFLFETAEKLRNADIFTTAQRGVVTTTDSGTLTADTDVLIAKSNVRNIRSLTVGGSPLTYGKDYTVNYDFDDGGTKKAKVSFTVAQTGAYEAQYDYGTERIFTDFSDKPMSISSYPRIAIGLSPSPTVPGGIGNVNSTDVFFEINVYDADIINCIEYQEAVRDLMTDNQIGFFYLEGATRPVSFGQPIPSPYEQGKTKIHQHKQEFKNVWNYEVKN